MLLHFGQLHTFWESIISTKLETKNRFDICHALVFFMHHHWVYYCRVTEFWRYGNLKFEKTALDDPQNSQKSLTISTILGLVFQSYIELATSWYGNPVLKNKKDCVLVLLDMVIYHPQFLQNWAEHCKVTQFGTKWQNCTQKMKTIIRCHWIRLFTT